MRRCSYCSRLEVIAVQPELIAVQPVARTGAALLCRQPALHLGGNAQPPRFPERIASLLSQWHLARLSDHFRRSDIPILALGRLCEYSFKRRANHDASRMSESATRPVTGDCLTTPNDAGPAWSLEFRFAGQYCSGCKIKPGSQPIPKMAGNHCRRGLLVSRMIRPNPALPNGIAPKFRGEVGRRNPATLVTRTLKRCCSVVPNRFMMIDKLAMRGARHVAVATHNPGTRRTTSTISTTTSSTSSRDRKAAGLSSEATFIRSSHSCLSRRTGALDTASRARKKISSGLRPRTC